MWPMPGMWKGRDKQWWHVWFGGPAHSQGAVTGVSTPVSVSRNTGSVTSQQTIAPQSLVPLRTLTVPNVPAFLDLKALLLEETQLPAGGAGRGGAGVGVGLG